MFPSNSPPAVPRHFDMNINFSFDRPPPPRMDRQNASPRQAYGMPGMGEPKPSHGWPHPGAWTPRSTPHAGPDMPSRISGSDMNVIHNATHKQLMASNNRVYTALYSGYKVVNAKYKQLSALYNKLNSSLSAISSKPQPAPTSAQVPSLPQPNQKDYPNIKFWFKPMYTVFQNEKTNSGGVVDSSQQKKKPQRGSGTLSKTGENVQTNFVEDETGKAVDGSVASAMRSLVHCLLSQMKEDGMTLSGTWRDASMLQRVYILQGLYREYPCISWCHDHWKGNMLVGRVLDGTKSVAKKKDKATVKGEPPQSLSPATGNNKDVSVDHKRERPVSPGAASPASKRPRKKLFTISPCPSPPPDPQPAEQQNSPNSKAPFAVLSLIAAAPKAQSPPTAASAPQEASTETVAQAEEEPSSNTTLGKKQPAVPAIVAVPLAKSLVVAPNLVSPGPVAASLDLGFELLQYVSAPLTDLHSNSVFGPPSAPSARLQSLVDGGKDKIGKSSKRATKKGKRQGSAINISLAGSSPNTAPGRNGLKRVTASKSLKNLFYIEYLKTNPMITPAAFEEMWGSLSKDEIKKWTDMGKAS
ncbi:hypothetical protein B0H34DRAFT_862716 [Crassisporium funariophilum]|nr:hypothetical protein B0H34DRAFT_862716 [Crassisporium funariophilum]